MRGPAEIVECRGDHVEMGISQGSATSPQILGVIEAFLRGPEFKLARPWYVVRSVYPLVARRKARRVLERPVELHYPEQAQRMRGIAAGASVDLDYLYLGLGAELMLNEIDWVPGACTALAVEAGRSASGEALLAKNFDYPRSYRVGYCVRRNLPRDGLSSVDVTVASLAGCHSGVNEAGLAVSYNYGYGRDRAGNQAPITLLVQRILERCRSVEEAERFARYQPRAGGAILAVCDAQGAAAVFEMSPTRFAVRYPENGVVACANHYETPEVSPVDVPHDAVYSRKALPVLRGERVHRSSERRREALERLVTSRRPVRLGELEAVLRDHGESRIGDDLTVCRHGPYYASTCSLILLPRQRRLRVLFGPACENEFVDHAVDGGRSEPLRPSPARAAG